MADSKWEMPPSECLKSVFSPTFVKVLIRQRDQNFNSDTSFAVFANRIAQDKLKFRSFEFPRSRAKYFKTMKLLVNDKTLAQMKKNLKRIDLRAGIECSEIFIRDMSFGDHIERLSHKVYQDYMDSKSGKQEPETEQTLRLSDQERDDRHVRRWFGWLFGTFREKFTKFRFLKKRVRNNSI